MSQSEYKSFTIGYGKGKGKGAVPKASASSPSDTSNMPAHVRALSAFIARGRKARGLLANGPVLDIHSHDNSEVVASLPLAISNVTTPLGNNLFTTVVYDLATLYSHRALPSNAAFDTICKHNSRVRDAVDALSAKWEAAEERRVAQLKHQAKVAAQAVKQQRKFEAKEAQNAQLGLVVREKMRVKGSRYTGAEAGYVWATFGKRVPV